MVLNKIFSEEETVQWYNTRKKGIANSLISFMEKSVLSNLKNISSNQYIVATLENGDVKRAIPYSRSLGFVTLGVSALFTSPYVVVQGPQTPKNEACLRRLQRGLPCEVVDHLTGCKE